MAFGRYTEDVPFNARIEFAQIDADFDFVVVALRLVDVLQVNLRPEKRRGDIHL